MKIPAGPHVYLLNRTHRRPDGFRKCLESIRRQTVLPVVVIISDADDGYVGEIDIPHIVYRPEKIRKPRWWIRHHNPFNDYFNQAMSVVPDGNYVVYLDDDDVLIDGNWTKTILAMNRDVLIGKFQLGADHDFAVIGTGLIRGKIGGSCIALRSEIARKNPWPQRAGGDFGFIRRVCRRYPPVFVDSIVAGVQSNLNRSWSRQNRSSV